ncbi:MAG: hypothetical protein AB7G93_08685 [Bdellovibrionales bacterium]
MKKIFLMCVAVLSSLAFADNPWSSWRGTLTGQLPSDSSAIVGWAEAWVNNTVPANLPGWRGVGAAEMVQMVSHIATSVATNPRFNGCQVRPAIACVEYTDSCRVQPEGGISGQMGPRSFQIVPFYTEMYRNEADPSWLLFRNTKYVGTVDIAVRLNGAGQVESLTDFQSTCTR